jgi:DNA-binding IclR family transcriptional regulator
MSQHDAWFAARTLQALEVLAFAPLSAPQVAAALGVHARTARRMLNRLVEEGYLARTGPQERQYEPTLRIVALAGQIVERSPLAVTAEPFVTRLREDSGATAHLLVPSYRSALCLVHRGDAGCDGGPGIRELVPAHCTAGGKVLLSWRDPWRESVLQQPLERHTTRTTTDAEALLEEVTDVRARGYAVEDREYRDDVRGVAAPVFASEDDAVAALALTAHADMTAEAGRVVAVAAELSAALEARRG